MAALTPALADELLDALPETPNARLIREALRDIALGRHEVVEKATLDGLLTRLDWMTTRIHKLEAGHD